jgi:tripartite ATP-independent transporter DctM subunit
VIVAWFTPEVLCALLFLSIVLLLLAGYPVAFTLAGVSLLFSFLAAAIGHFDLSYLSAFPQRIFAVMRNETLVAVPLFVFMGVMLERSQVAEDLLETMGGLFGKLRGGLGYSVCLVGALLAASTGIVGATVVTMGLLSLPTMLRRGYDPRLACGTICAAGTLGQIIPPSIVLVLLGDQLSGAYQKAQYATGNFAPDTVSVNDLFAGALIPGLTLVLMYLLYLIAVVIARPSAAPAIPPQDPGASSGDRPLWRLLRTLLAPLALIVAVLGSILGGLASPTEAAGVGAVGALMLAGQRLAPRGGWPVVLGVFCFLALLVLTAYFDLRMQRDIVSRREWQMILLALLLSAGLVWGIAAALVATYRKRDAAGGRVLAEVVRQTLLISTMVFSILLGASMFSLVFRGLGGDLIIENFLGSLPGGTVTVLLVVMLTMFLLGFILDFLEIVFIVVPVVAPILLAMELAPGVPMSPVWLGVMMAMNLQTSFLTPPFGFSLFYLRGVAPASVNTSDIYRGAFPFVLIQLAMLAVLWYLPALATWLPAMLYSG